MSISRCKALAQTLEREGKADNLVSIYSDASGIHKSWLDATDAVIGLGHLKGLSSEAIIELASG